MPSFVPISPLNNLPKHQEPPQLEQDPPDNNQEVDLGAYWSWILSFVSWILRWLGWILGLAGVELESCLVYLILVGVDLDACGGGVCRCLVDLALAGVDLGACWGGILIFADGSCSGWGGSYRLQK